LNPRAFALERYFARYEFNTRYLLCSSDPQTMPIRELLALQPGSDEELGELRLGYTESRGGSALRERISGLYDRVGDDGVLVHAGPQEAIFTFANAVFERGDHAIVQFPAYQSQYSIAEAIGVEVSRWDSDLAREGSPDVDELERLVRPATRAVILTTPNNPTGYAFTRVQMDRVVEIARRHGLWLFGDEVYRGTEREAAQIAAVVDLYERGVSLGGLSKGHGLAGLRIGWIATCDRALYDRLAAFKDYLTICNSAPSEFLAEIALRHSEKLLERVREICARNLDRLDDFFARHEPLFEWQRPRAGTTAFPRYRGGSSEAFCARLVRDAGVLLLPSTVFDAGDERIRFGYGRTDLPEALAALEDFLSLK
jgi:aspartate/methionine/tyrosine aminotransferase